MAKIKKEIFKLKNIGPIKEAKIELGDLTVFVGPQASGKTVALEFIHLLYQENYKYIYREINKPNQPILTNVADFLDFYLGENMSMVWDKNKSRIIKNNKSVNLKNLLVKKKYATDSTKTSNYIPAQRVMMFDKYGGIKDNEGLESSDPFVVKDFTKEIRDFVSFSNPRIMKELKDKENLLLFPSASKTMNADIENTIAENLFKGYKLYIEKSKLQNRRLRLVLKRNKNDSIDKSIPFLSWSAGQREFSPLVLSLIRLLAKKDPEYDLLIIEEPEMGLHPDGVMNTLLLILYTIARGYKVILSTHSHHILEFLWYLRRLNEFENVNQTDELLKIFMGNNFSSAQAKQNLKNILKKFLPSKFNHKIYFFKDNDKVKEITKLHSLDDDPDISEWGRFNTYSKKFSDSIESLK